MSLRQLTPTPLLARLYGQDWYLPPQAPFFLHYLLVLFPIGKFRILLSEGHSTLKLALLATAFAFLTLISLLPSLVSRRHAFPPAMYLGFAIPSTITSTLAFAFAMAEFSSGYSHFNDQLNRGNNKYGPAVRAQARSQISSHAWALTLIQMWMSLAAPIIFIVVTAHAFWRMVIKLKERRAAYARVEPPKGY